MFLDLDHTADVQFHVWGTSLVHAFENMGACFGNYVTDISTVDIDETENVQLRVSGSYGHAAVCRL
jgi:SHS2 domain-containing protein